MYTKFSVELNYKFYKKWLTNIKFYIIIKQIVNLNKQKTHTFSQHEQT